MTQIQESFPVFHDSTSDPDTRVSGARLWYRGTHEATRKLGPLLFNAKVLRDRNDTPPIATEPMAPFLFASATMAIDSANDPEAVRNAVLLNPQITRAEQNGNYKLWLDASKGVEVDFIGDDGIIVDPEEEAALRSLGRGVVYRFGLETWPASHLGRILHRQGDILPDKLQTLRAARNKTLGIAVPTNELPDGIRKPAQVRKQAELMSHTLEKDITPPRKHVVGIAAITAVTLPKKYQDR